MTKGLVVLAALVALSARAQEPKPVSEGTVVELRGTIEAINHSTREMVVEINGQYHTFKVKPDVKRFGELKVGDRLAASYHEAILLEVRQPGAPPPSPAAAEPLRVPGQAVRPSGAVVKQKKATVEVRAIDAARPSITVLTHDGRLVTYKVEKPERLLGVKVGDKIDITYTEALIVSVE
jgi:hypothetical protein